MRESERASARDDLLDKSLATMRGACPTRLCTHVHAKVCTDVLTHVYTTSYQGKACQMASITINMVDCMEYEPRRAECVLFQKMRTALAGPLPQRAGLRLAEGRGTSAKNGPILHAGIGTANGMRDTRV